MKGLEVYRDMGYVVDLKHPLQAPCGIVLDIEPAVEALVMWESRRDFQEEWEGWRTRISGFHAFHSSAFPTLACHTWARETSFLSR